MTLTKEERELAERWAEEHVEIMWGDQTKDTVYESFIKGFEAATLRANERLEIAVRALRKYSGIAVCLEDGDNFVADKALEEIEK